MSYVKYYDQAENLMPREFLCKLRRIIVRRNNTIFSPTAQLQYFCQLEPLCCKMFSSNAKDGFGKTQYNIKLKLIYDNISLNLAVAQSV
jgi:hypothetical protein